MANVGTGSVGKTLIGTGRGNSPTYVSLGTDSGLTQHGVVIAQGNNAFNATAAGTDGQVLTAVTNGDPVWSSHVAIDYHDSIYIVGANSSANYSSIATAYAAAVSAGAPATVFIQPGTYTEDIALTAGINLCAHACDSSGIDNGTSNVTISGKLSASFSGAVSISGINLQTNGNYALSVTGSNQTRVDLINCKIWGRNNNAVQFSSSNSGSQIAFLWSQGDIAATYAYFDHSSSGSIELYNCLFLNNGSSTAVSSVSAGVLEIRNSYFNNNVTTSSSAGVNINNSEIWSALVLNGVAVQGIVNCAINAGSSSCVSIGTGVTVSVSNCTINSSNTNSITGLGTLKYNGLNFVGSSSLINTTNQIPLVNSNDAMTVVTPGSYPYTTIPQDALILVDTSSASNTIVPLASPTIGQKHIIKDKSGNAGTAGRNITITPSGKNIDGAASKIININYGSVTIIYNGVEWSIC